MGAISWTEDLTANVAKRILMRNVKRRRFIIVNNSGADIYIGYTPNVATSGAAQGLPVIAAGGVLEEYEPWVWRGEIWAICASNVTINISEESYDPWEEAK